MPVRKQTIALEGFKGLQAAFKLASVELISELKDTLFVVTEPVRADAVQLAGQEITKMTTEWSQFRLGITPTSVYVAPVQRGTKAASRKRPKFAGLLLGRSMIPALEENQPHVIEGVDKMLGDIGRKWEQVPKGSDG